MIAIDGAVAVSYRVACSCLLFHHESPSATSSVLCRLPNNTELTHDGSFELIPGCHELTPGWPFELTPLELASSFPLVLTPVSEGWSADSCRRFLRALIIPECLDFLVSPVLPLIFGICALQRLQIALFGRNVLR